MVAQFTEESGAEGEPLETLSPRTQTETETIQNANNITEDCKTVNHSQRDTQGKLCIQIRKFFLIHLPFGNGCFVFNINKYLGMTILN